MLLFLIHNHILLDLEVIIIDRLDNECMSNRYITHRSGIISSIMFLAPGLDVCTMHIAHTDTAHTGCLGKQGKHSMYEKKDG